MVYRASSTLSSAHQTALLLHGADHSSSERLNGLNVPGPAHLNVRLNGVNIRLNVGSGSQHGSRTVSPAVLTRPPS
jgi:hypothetical protein